MREVLELDQAICATRGRVQQQHEQVQGSRRRSREVSAWAQAELDQVRQRLTDAGWIQVPPAERLQRARDELDEAFKQAREVHYAPDSAQMQRLRRVETRLQRLEARYYPDRSGSGSGAA